MRVAAGLAPPTGGAGVDDGNLRAVSQSMLATPLGGVLPLAPTHFDANDEVDYAGQKRVLDFLVDAGVDAICILANYSEQFSNWANWATELASDPSAFQGTRVNVFYIGGCLDVQYTGAALAQWATYPRSPRS
jgi:hypothetical protein